MINKKKSKKDKQKKRLAHLLKKGFAVETHLHTSETSACATASGAQLSRYYKSLGYDAIIVTDHFFNGNTVIPSNYSWSQKVALFCRGYESALEEGQKIGLKVFFGWEYSYHGTDFLTYGLDRNWLLEHPDMLNWGLEGYLTCARKDGAFIVHAHPFRQAPYIQKIRLFPSLVDGVEVINSRNPSLVYDKQAYEYARQYRLPMTSGSDAHCTNIVPGGGLVFSDPILNISDFIQQTKKRKGKHLIGVQRLR